MLGIQILIIAFAFFALARTIGQFRAGELPRAWLGFWIVFWFAAVLVTLLPQTTDMAARLVGVGRGADFVTYISLIALFYFIFRLVVKVERTEREITRLVRSLALEGKKKEE